jgi:hypothetical protein
MVRRHGHREQAPARGELPAGRWAEVLLDCGMFQGEGVESDEMNRDFGFDPRTSTCWCSATRTSTIAA